MNREYAMLATTHKDIDKIPKDHVWSTKYDGMRCLWLPTCRGLPVYKIPFCAEPEPEVICTGLFSRYGKVVHAPDWFLDRLPNFPLDGELFTGRDDFQRLISICRSHNGDWSPVTYMAFDAPRYLDIFTDGRINNNVVKDKMISYGENVHLVGPSFIEHMMPFFTKNSLTECVYGKLLYSDHWNNTVKLVPQSYWNDTNSVRTELDKEIEMGGEGLIGRTLNSIWVPKRSKNVIKLKPTLDDEATIIGFIEGKGRHEGRLGAYIVTWKGKQFQLSGMTDYQRENPLCRGTVITFRYRTLTSDGYPREARFIREYLHV